jgi:hypothetical protein
MEACGGSHFMARKLEELGHSPKLISPQFVRPFVKSNKNDFARRRRFVKLRPSSYAFPAGGSTGNAGSASVRESLVQDAKQPIKCMLFCWICISVPEELPLLADEYHSEDNSLPLYLSQLLLKLQQHVHYLVEQIKDLESQLKGVGPKI